MLTAIFSQPRTDEIHRSKMVNRWLLSLFAARKLNYISIYIHHCKMFKKKRKLQLYTIHCKSKTNQRETGCSKWLNFLQKFGIGSTKTRKTSVLPKLWEGFIHPHIDRMNKSFVRLVRTGETLYLCLLHRL